MTRTRHGAFPTCCAPGRRCCIPRFRMRCWWLARRMPSTWRLLRQVGLTSCMIVPLAVRERVLGALTFVSAESGFRYGTADVALAEDLARRAATAIDHARLYQEARAAQAALRERAEALAEADRPRICSWRCWGTSCEPRCRRRTLRCNCCAGTPARSRRRSGSGNAWSGKPAGHGPPGRRPARPLAHQPGEADAAPRNRRSRRADPRGRRRPAAREAAGLTLYLELPEAPVFVEGDPTRPWLRCSRTCSTTPSSLPIAGDGRRRGSELGVQAFRRSGVRIRPIRSIRPARAPERLNA